MLISIHIYIYTLNWSECSMDSVFLGRLADRCDESGEDILAASSYGLAWMIWMCFLCTESRSHLFNSTCLQSPQNFGRCKMYLLWWSLWSINIYIYIYISIYKFFFMMWYALLRASIGPNVSERCANRSERSHHAICNSNAYYCFNS